MSPRAVKSLIEFFQTTRSVTLNPPADGESEARFLQYVSDTAAGRGVSVGNPEIRARLDQFRTENESQFTAVSDAAGKFELKNVPAGSYTIRSRREGFFGTSANADSPDAASVPVTVGSRQTATVTISMLPGATISGQVVDSSGRPQINTDVQAYVVTYTNGYPALRTVVTKATDDRGMYRLYYFTAGEYLVAAVPRQSAATDPSAEKPVITFYPGTADVATATPVKIRNGEQLERIDLTMRSAVPSSLSGTIISTIPPPTAPAAAANAPTVTASLMLLLSDPNTPDNTGVTANSGVRIIANATLNPSSGQFKVSGILPGSYDLYARLTEPNTDGGSGFAFGHVSVDVRGQDISNLELKVHPSVRVTGTVRMNGQSAKPSTVRVSLQADGSSTKIPVYQAIGRRAVVAAADGSFTIPAITAGRFRVQVEGLDPDLYVSDVRQGARSIYDTGFEVGADPPQPIDIIVSSGAATVEGLVRDSAGKPLANAAIAVVPEGSRRQNRALYSTATSDTQGRFTFTGVSPGNYKVFAWESVTPGAYFNERFLASSEDRGRFVNVTESSVVQTELVALPGTAR